ncbi:DUF4132 domain-containing protein [Planomonospora parontospora]|uniref:DUF4132 domain-containing protein n=1 Tax=Planomonospora parontospora TaxID=58119 RepID=UPI0016710F79|nr:DUF4132 domain-containing protein [Planomonospora parontospora]GGL35606.1 hypothetical protein GCM10014719_40950 [Planomonospora parontospora subsp. antibiotica]GII17465.1 hypothetical protein Ppa05_41910 [Planomonospora parontospora subsp. antibiotica]
MGVIDGLPVELHGWLDELDEATLAVFRRLDATLRPQDAHRFVDDALLRELSSGWGEAEWRTTALWAQLLTRTTDGSVAGQVLLTRLAQRKLRWTPQERELLWRTTLTPPAQYRTDVYYRIPISSIRGLPPSEREPLLPHLMLARQEMEAVPFSAGWAAKRLLDDLLAEHLAGDPAEATRSLVPECDGFAVLLREEYGERLGEADALPLLRHWTTATSATPAPQWTARAAELLTPRTIELIREILGRVPAYREGPWHNGYREVVTYLRERTAELLRGMIWTCELIDEPWVTGLLGDVALATGTGIGGSGPNSRSERMANAALGVLARRGGTEAVAQLARVQAKVRRKSILAKVEQILESIAVQTGLSPEQLLERTVPTFGLDHDGTRTEQGLTLSLTGAITYNGRKTIPRSVERELLADFRATAKELKKAILAERFRVEHALASERTWSWQEACEFYLDHPITGAFARNLIWEILQGPAGLPVRVDGTWELTDPAGRRTQPRPDTPVRLWHPISHTADEVRAWRDHLLAIGLRQPFKQAFREVYLLTPAEEETHDHSRRFSDHLLRYGQAKALLTETARTRRDALARLLPRLKIADRAELTDRFLRVRGDLRTYRIHLGSGNILMEPNDAHLCIVPGRDRDTGSVFLPFEEDGGMLSVILSKAFLLAADTAITDPSITRQLTG